MARVKKSRIRIVSSRGHSYAQEVRYEWDKALKRGVTHVIRTLGPLETSRRLPGRMAPERIQSFWEAQQTEKAEAFRLRSESVKTPDFEGDRLGLNQPSSLPRLLVDASNAEPPSQVGNEPTSLTGKEGLDQFDGRIMRLVEQMDGLATRRRVTKAAATGGIARPNHHQSLRRHVSFALTRLHARGLLWRSGEGGKGHEYQYRPKESPVRASAPPSD
jgi:hypothetical protein